MNSEAKLIIVGFGAVLALGVAGFIFWKKYGDKITTAINPADPNNLANTAASSVVQTVTGGAAMGGEDSVGGVFARAREWLSGDDAKIKALTAGSGNALTGGAQ